MSKFKNPGIELFHTEERTHAHRQTDMTNLIVVFRNFASASKKLAHYSKIIIDNKARKCNDLRPTVHF